MTDFSEDKCFYKAPGKFLHDASIKKLSVKLNIIINLLNLIILLQEVLKKKKKGGEVNCISEKENYYYKFGTDLFILFYSEPTIEKILNVVTTP